LWAAAEVEISAHAGRRTPSTLKGAVFRTANYEGRRGHVGVRERYVQCFDALLVRELNGRPVQVHPRDAARVTANLD
jgi:hypothetical protein